MKLNKPARRRGPGVDVRPGTVRQARIDAGLSLAKLAGDDLTRGAIYLIETGRARPSMATLQVIAARTGRPLSHFLAKQPPGGQPAADLDLEIRRCQLLCLGGSHVEAAQACEELLELPLAAAAEATVHLCLGQARMSMRQLDAADRPLEQARLCFLELGDPWSAARCQLLLATAAMLAAEPDAERLAELAVAGCEALEPVPELTLAAAHAVLGDVRALRGRWTEAADSYRQAVERGRDTGSFAGIGAHYRQVALDQAARGNRASAAEWANRAVGVLEAAEWLSVVPHASFGLGRALAAGDRNDEAAERYADAVREYRELRMEERLVRVLVAQADVCLARQDLDQADQFIGEAREAALHAGDRHALALVYCLTGRAAAARGDAEGRDREFTAGCELLGELGEREAQIEAWICYARLLEEAGEVRQALDQWKRVVLFSRPGLEPQLRDARATVWPSSETSPPGAASPDAS